MAITIHHGPNGGYKTSGIVQDLFVPAALEGRVVITNIRGMSRDRTIDVLGEDKVPESFDLIFVDTTTQDGRDRTARFFHWAPHGALMIWDEAGKCFPKRWRQSDLDKLDYKTPDEAEAEERPYCWSEAWEEHRHYNWDIVLSTPNIKSIRLDIRNTAEGAYKHANLATIGLKGRYKEGYHDADDNGSPGQITITETKRIKKRTFKLYDSTKTGQVKDTINGKSLFKSVPLLLGVGISASSFVYAFTSGGLDYFTKERSTVALSANEIRAMESQSQITPGNLASPTSNNIVSGNPLADQSAGEVPIEHYFAGFTFHITGYQRFGKKRYFTLVITRYGYEDIHISSRRLAEIGYQTIPINRCTLIIKYGDFEDTATCSPVLRPREQRTGLLSGFDRA